MKADNQNLSDKQLKYAYWFLLHKKQFKKVGIILLIIFDILMVILAVMGLIRYLYNYSEFKELSQNMPNYIDWAAYHQENQPVDLQINQVRVIQTDSDQVDIGVLVQNINNDWGVPKLTYQFLLAGGQTTPLATTFLLPNGSKYLMALSVSTVGRTASLQIVEFGWQRIKSGQLLLVPDVVISENRFIPASQVEGLTRGGQVSWLVANKSAYNYWDVGFQVIIFTGQREVGFNYLQISSLDSLESKNLSVNMIQRLSSVTSVLVIPEVNIYDPGIIKSW